MVDLKASYAQDPETQSILLNLQQNPASSKGFSLQQGLLLKKGCLWVVQHSPFQLQVLEFLHSKPTTRHSGYHKTVHSAKANFYWRGMQKDINKFVQECVVCQVSKPELIHPLGLLQPLPILSKVWSDISMDFIEGLPVSPVHRLFWWLWIDLLSTGTLLLFLTLTLHLR